MKVRTPFKPLIWIGLVTWCLLIWEARIGSLSTLTSLVSQSIADRDTSTSDDLLFRRGIEVSLRNGDAELDRKAFRAGNKGDYQFSTLGRHQLKLAGEILTLSVANFHGFSLSTVVTIELVGICDKAEMVRLLRGSFSSLSTNSTNNRVKFEGVLVLAERSTREISILGSLKLCKESDVSEQISVLIDW